MPWKDRDHHHAYMKQRNKDRKDRGECVQCGVKTPINPKTRKPYARCGRGTYTDTDGVIHQQNNCRGGNKVAVLRYQKREMEDIGKESGIAIEDTSLLVYRAPQIPLNKKWRNTNGYNKRRYPKRHP